MKITYEIKRTLVETASKELKEAENEVTRAKDALAKAEILFKEKEVVLDWASGLLVGADLMMKPDWNKVVPKPFIRKLYYVPSRSGRKYGHYIEVTDVGISCTCPGFKNRLYCHATRTIQSGTGIYKYIWLASVKEWDKKRDEAMAYDG